jgi:hypothetical protein
VLCQFFFAVSGVTGGLVVKTGWFRALELDCRLVGQGMEILVRGKDVLGGENGGYARGDKGDMGPGMHVKKSARIVQRLLAVARGANGHWAKHVEGELKGAWPGLKKHWSKSGGDVESRCDEM